VYESLTKFASPLPLGTSRSIFRERKREETADLDRPGDPNGDLALKAAQKEHFNAKTRETERERESFPTRGVLVECISPPHTVQVTGVNSRRCR